MTDLPVGHPLLGRVVADAATDPAGWAAARPHHLGASDVAKYAKLSSVEIYVRNKLTESSKSFGESQYTRNGHAHEPGLMAFAGLVHNTRTYSHAEIPEFTATPDGYSWTDAGVLVLGEAKVKHKIVTGPTPAEVRQVWWAQYVTGALLTKWVWQTLHPETHRPYGPPQMIRIPFDAEAFAPVLEIATQVRAAMLAARRFEENR